MQHHTAPSSRKQRAARTYDAIKQWHEPVRQAIRQAEQRRAINHPTGEFLHKLLSACGDKPYTATPKAELARLCNKSLSSIKLYIRTGVEAGFLRVSGSRIYFVQLEAPASEEKTYDALVEEATALAAAGKILDAGLLMQRAAELRAQQAEQPDQAEPEPAPEPVQEPLFLAENESKNCPDSDNSLPDHPLKTLNTSGGGGEAEVPETETVRVLRRAGAWVPSALRELADRPVEEARQAVALARRVRDPGDPGALAVWFAQQLRDGLIAVAQAKDTRTSPPGKHAAPIATLDTPTDPPANPHAALWQQAQDALRKEVSPIEFETWLKDTALLELNSERAIVGVPNIFARDRLAADYRAAIAAALGVVEVEIVIGVPT